MQIGKHNIPSRTEGKRGCGFRKTGGLYMVASGDNFGECGRLPIPLEVCPTCNQGIKHSRGFTWIEVDMFIQTTTCKFGNTKCLKCPLGRKQFGKQGLIWIGEKFYKTPQAFVNEGLKQGISRRIPSVPKGFKIGEHYIFLAHIKAIMGIGEDEKGLYPIMKPGIFSMFKPTAIEYVVTGQETEKEIDSLLKRGITPIHIENAEKGSGKQERLFKEV
jgi:hypothetical protein